MLVTLRLDNSSQFWHPAPLRHPRNPPGCFGAFFPVFSSPCHRQDDQGGIFKAQEEPPHNLLHRFCSVAKAELPPELCHDHSAVTPSLQKSLWICVSRTPRISEYPELEGTKRMIQVQLLELQRTPQQSPLCLWWDSHQILHKAQELLITSRNSQICKNFAKPRLSFWAAGEFLSWVKTQWTLWWKTQPWCRIRRLFPHPHSHTDNSS